EVWCGWCGTDEPHTGTFWIKEIINALKAFSTPVISTQLLIVDDPEYARQVKGRIKNNFRRNKLNNFS
ncbi:Uncharacterized protein APZ42_008325, partial [Daphnia magna]